MFLDIAESKQTVLSETLLW